MSDRILDKKYLSSEAYFEKAKKITPGGVHSPVRSFKGLGRAPVFFTKAEGSKLWSVEGKKYIDYCMSFGPMILGHRDPEVSEAVHEMIDTAWSFGACEIYSLELAEWITGHLPFVEKLRFVSSGTEAVMSALRVARAATGRQKVLKFDGCYHGHVDSLLVKSGSGLAGEASSSSAGVSENVASETLVISLDDDLALEKIFQERGKEIAAVIIEPLPANYGLLVQRKEFIQKMVKLAKASGSLVIFDEVISGFRVALGGMAEVLEITPDLVCYGKVIGGGFPVGCYGGRKELLDLVAPMGPVYQAGTLSANPVGMRAGLVTLKKMKRLNGWNVLAEKGKKFSADLQNNFEACGSGLKVDHYGSLFWIRENTVETIRSINQIPANQGETFKKLFLKALDLGIYLAPNAYEVGFLSMAHSNTDLEETQQKLLQAIT
ncbi:MAG: glutamate-1-semialdehyde 2,1-aminomutase [Pseudobdellovibrio sp.]